MRCIHTYEGGNALKAKLPFIIPFILILCISVSILIYSVFTSSPPDMDHIPRPMEVEGGFRPEEGMGEWFKWLGTMAVWLVAFSASWYGFKRLKKKTKLVKKTSKYTFRWHHWAGWIAVGLIVVHATFFLLTKLNDPNIKTGLAAGIPLVALALYGLFLQRALKPIIRLLHTLLAAFTLIAIAIHAGGTFWAALSAVIAAWLLAWAYERHKQKGLTGKAS